MYQHLRSVVYLIPLVAIAGAIGYLFALRDYGTQGGFLVGLALALIGALTVGKLAKAEQERWFALILFLGLVVKLAGSLGRMIANELFYGGQFDSGRYHKIGKTIAEDIWAFNFDGFHSYFEFGTRFAEFYSGVAHAIIGPTLAGVFMLYGFLSFLGAFCFYRAFRIAFPHANNRLFAILIFLTPSLVYWPNGLGKDALIFLFIGLTSYGLALHITTVPVRGMMFMVLGVLGVLTIRPHVAGLLAIAIIVALVLGRMNLISKRPFAYISGIAVIIVFGLLFLPTVLDFVGLQELRLENVVERIVLQQSYARGGSAFSPVSITDVRSIPLMFATITVRPFPWEAHNVQAFLQAAEGVAILGFMVWHLKSLGRAIAAIRYSPFILFVLTYVILFIPIFSGIANFGTLARERAMFFPLFFMLFAFHHQARESTQSGNVQ